MLDQINHWAYQSAAMLGKPPPTQTIDTVRVLTNKAPKRAVVNPVSVGPGSSIPEEVEQDAEESETKKDPSKSQAESQPA